MSLIFFGSDSSDGEQEGQIHFTNPHLNESQREAIEFALKQKELAVIHGPPGTYLPKYIMFTLMNALVYVKID